jgi:hypothetical protein
MLISSGCTPHPITQIRTEHVSYQGGKISGVDLEIPLQLNISDLHMLGSPA